MQRAGCITPDEAESAYDLLGCMLDLAQGLTVGDPPERAQRAQGHSVPSLSLPSRLLHSIVCERHKVAGAPCHHCLFELALRQAIELRKIAIREQQATDARVLAAGVA